MMSSALGFGYFLAAVAMVTGNYVHEMKIVKLPFKWENCQKTPPLPINFTAFSLTPDPIKLGSDAQVSFTAQVTEDIGTTNTLQIDVDAKLDIQGTTVDVCDYLTCHFPDFCSILKQYKSNCPGAIKKLVPQCQCPLKKNEYTVTKATIPLPSAPMKVDGLLHTTVDVKESGKQMGCIKMEICIGSC